MPAVPASPKPASPKLASHGAGSSARGSSTGEPPARRPGEPRRPRWWRNADLLVGLSGLAAAALVALNPGLGPVVFLAGVWFVLGLPTAQLYAKAPWSTADVVERIAYSLVSTLLMLMVGGLIVNTVLPLAGVDRPLDRLPLFVTLLVVNGALALWRRARWRELARTAGATLAWPGRRSVTIIVAAALSVGLAVVGAIRLNNGAGGGVVLFMLFYAAVVLTLLYVWNNRLGPGTVATVIYFIAAAMLLMTSLRGWYVTGHDVQREYAVFELTSGFADWSMARYPDAYNACLSITILPTVLARLTRIFDPYVYKLLFQLLFAYTAVAVYRITRRFLSNLLAITAAIYFLAFPTFFTDMPFLNRQEIAFLFVGAALLAVTNAGISRRRRQVMLAVFSVGMALSHYSTTYFFLGVLACYLSLRAISGPVGRVTRWLGPRIPVRDGLRPRRRPHVADGSPVFAAAARPAPSPELAPSPDEPCEQDTPEPRAGALALPGLLGVLIRRPRFLSRLPVLRRRRGQADRAGRPRGGRPVVGLANVAFLAVVVVIWTGAITGTSGGVAMTLKESIGGLVGSSASESKSSDVSYSLVGSGAVDPAQRLAAYRAVTLAQTGGTNRAQIYFSTQELDRYPTRLVPVQTLPTGPAGRVLDSVGFPTDALNTLLRQGAARMLQLFVLIGLIAALVNSRRRGFRPSREYFLLACGSFAMLVGQVVLPALSVNYGILRAFQQGLFTLGPFLAWGSVAVFLRFGPRFAVRAAAGVALLFFLSLTGFFSQLLGRYPAQLNLNNAGTYYDIYYTHPQEIAAADWLKAVMKQYPASSGGTAAQTDIFSRDRLNTATGLPLEDGLYPTQLRRDLYLLVGTSVVRTGDAALSYQGDILTYRYPEALLNDTKNRVYDNGSAEVYR
ncbi:DUF2206 domain-containing protein [Frankia sp. AiPa1]|uniref:DUF2206 domain-containing protein n=1 Tax=Frankia sp. AiPa1 TaxID=573492 RepID=UPI00202B622E|nr:DUF2206 domain-containing protein [Frankia sp. AiPa1]MCL9758332.1 DUF2206 domain-containing protein [Frankia sp. AiPa1]